MAIKNITLPEKHSFSMTRSKIEEICLPLKQSGITHFLYARFFNNNSFYVLTPNWDASHHFNKQFIITPPNLHLVSGDRIYYLPNLIEPEESSQVIDDWHNLFNIKYPIYFIEKYNNYLDFYSYSSISNNPKIINFYLNNIDFLEKFKYYFKDKARNLIKKAEKNKLYLPKEFIKNFHNHEKILIKGKLNQIEPRRYRISFNQKEISITHKELELFKQLAKGYTIKEAAKHLSLSPRTAESYFKNIRTKLNMHHKADILELFSKVHLL